MPFQKLPDECQKVIANFLTFKNDFTNLHLTSKSVHQVVEKTKRGQLVRQAITLKPSSLETLCMKAVSQLPNLKSISPAISLGILAGVVFNSAGSFVLSSLGLNKKLSIVLTCFLLILRSTHIQLITKKMSISGQLALSNLVLVTFLIMNKRSPDSGILDPLISGVDVAGLNLISAGAIAAGNRFQLFYNNKKETIPKLFQQIKALDLHTQTQDGGGPIG